MTSQISLSKLERLSSLRFNENLDGANNYMPTTDEVYELNKFQKIKQFHNITKFEQLNNGGNHTLVNSLQDTELNDLILSVNSFIHLCIHKIHKKDRLFKVVIENFAYDPNESDIKTFTKSSKKAAPAPVLFEENKNLTYLNASNKKPAADPDTPADSSLGDENPILVDSIVTLDFLRNGLKCGPLQNQKENNYFKSMLEQNAGVNANALPSLVNGKQEKESDAEKESKNDNATPSVSQLSFNKPMSSVVKPMSSIIKPMSSSQQTTNPNQNSAQLKAFNALNSNKQLITFKYMLVFNLSKKHFELKRVNLFY